MEKQSELVEKTKIVTIKDMKPEMLNTKYTINGVQVLAAEKQPVNDQATLINSEQLQSLFKIAPALFK
jgi:hypothetical protein